MINKRKQMHIDRIKKNFKSVHQFYVWLKYENPKQSAFSYGNNDSINPAFVRIIEMYEHLKTKTKFLVAD